MRTDSSTFWLVVAILAAIVAFWLALQVLGFLLKVVILIAAVVVAVTAYRSWEEARKNGGDRFAGSGD